MENTAKNCNLCRETNLGLYVLPCRHSHCLKCIQRQRTDRKTLECGVCHSKYNISHDSLDASSDESTTCISTLQIICLLETTSKSEIWCCICGKYIVNCYHGGHQVQKTYSDCLDSNVQGCHSDVSFTKNSNLPEENEVSITFETPPSSLDFESTDLTDPTFSSDFYSSVNLDRCTEHGYPLTNFCFCHTMLSCPECTSLHHKQCNTSDIHEAATKIPTEPQINKLQNNLLYFTDIQEGLICEMEGNNTEVNKEKERIWITFKEFKSAVQEKIAQLEDSVKSQIQDTIGQQEQLQSDIDHLKERHEVLKNTTAQLQAISSGTAENLQTYCHVKAKLEEQKDFFKFRRQQMSKISMNSTKYEELVDFLKQIPELIKVENYKVKPESLKKMKCAEKLQVRRWTHTARPRVTGMCFLGDTLVICDNTRHRIFTISGSQVWYCVKLQHSSWDVTAIGEQKIAVSTTSGIQMVDFKYLPNKELGLPVFLPTAFPCFGVCYFEENLYIASNSHIYKLSLDGSRHQSIKCQGLSVQSVCVQDTNCIYYTDTNSDRLFCMDSKGKTLNEFTSVFMRAPRGIAIGPSTDIMVVNSFSNTVLRFTKDGLLVESTELKGRQDQEEDGPHAICYYKDTCAIAAGQFIYKCHFV